MRNFARRLSLCCAAAVLLLPAAAHAQIRIKIPNPVRNPPATRPGTQPNTPTTNAPSVPGVGNTTASSPGNSGGAAEKQQNRQRFNEMKNEVPNLFQAVSYFQVVYADPTEYSTGTNYGVEPSLAALARLDELCKTKYAGIKDFGSFRGWEESPETWCDIAAKRNELAERLKVNQVFRSVDMKSEVAAVDTAIKRLTTGDGFITDGDLEAILDRAKYKREHHAVKKFAAAGVALPADFYKELDAKLDELSAEADKHAASATFPAVKFRDAAIEQFARAKFKEYHQMTVVKIHMTDTEWRIYKNSLGIPTERYRGGVVLLKAPGAAGARWCQHRTFHVKELYAGGRWGSRTLDFSGSAEPIKCQ